jgi:undecaprenyl-phosphate galactose phosphotransferase
MPNSPATEKALELPYLVKVNDSFAPLAVKKRRFFYKLLLVAHDVALVMLSFSLGALILDPVFFAPSNYPQITFLGLIALSVLAFFQSSGIYSYHLVFIAKNHLGNLFRSYLWIAVTLIIAGIVFLWPQLFSGLRVVGVTVVFAMAVMLISRFWGTQLLNLVKSLGISFALVGIVGLLNPRVNPLEYMPLLLVPTGFALAVAMVSISRLFLVNVVFNVFKRKAFRRQLAIIGMDEQAKAITKHIIDLKAPYWVSGVVAEYGLDTPIPKKSLGVLRNLPEIASRHQIEEILVTDERIDKRTLISLLDFCTSAGITVWFPPQLMPIITAKVYNDNFCGLPMIRLCSQKNMWLFNKLKHAGDAIVTLIGFTLVLPLFLLIALAVKLSSEGPVFYRAEVIGKQARRFKMFKFRSMRIGTSSDIHKEYVAKLIKGEIKSEGNDNKPLKIVDDPRITPVGKIIRKLSLDELPQLINVLKGDMSLVGPRPCLPYEWELYEDWQKKRTSVRPGITGLWQVTGRSEVSFEDMMLLDFYYIYNRSLMLDINILYETVFAVLEKRGAY